LSLIRKENLKLREESLRHSQEITKLSDEVNALKAKVQQAEPLVKVGASIRLRFLEQILSYEDGRKANDELIEAGDRAI